MKYKIVRTISLLPGVREGPLCFPPIGTGILARHLRDLGHDIAQDDLHIRWYRTASKHHREKLEHLSADERRLWNYLEGGSDPDWDWFGEKVTGLSDFQEPDVILFSLISSDSLCCKAALALARYLKKKFGKSIVVGGEYFAYAPIFYEIDRIIPLGVIDYYISGFAEKALEGLLSILSGQSSPARLADIPGLCYSDGGQVRKNPYTLFHDVVPPDFEGLPVELYRWSAPCQPPEPILTPPTDELILPFHTSTGCPFNCSFCDCSGIDKVSVLPPDAAVKELASLVDRYGCRTFFFLNNTLNISRGYIKQLCSRIIKSKLDIQWFDCGTVRGVDKEVLIKMREAGVIRIVWGLESGSNRVLKYVKKPITLDQASSVFTMAHEVGIWNGVEIIVGMPTETDNEFRETMAFLEAHTDVIDEVWPNPFYLNSNSDMCRNPSAYGLFNVLPVNRGLTKNELRGSFAASFIFDEMNGLCWREKEDQLEQRIGEITEHIMKLGLYPMAWEHEQQPNLLSWCYRQCRSKSEVQRLYRSYFPKLALHKWKAAGWQAESLETLADEILREIHRRKLNDLPLEKTWNEISPERYSPTYKNLEPEQAMLVDGKFHDMQLYAKVKKALLNS
jgi:hypothetical protein